MRAILTAFLGAALNLSPAAAPAHGPGGCPTPEPEDEARVKGFLSLAQLPEYRNIADLGSASPEDVHALTGERARSTCVALWRAMASSGRQWSTRDRAAFYRSGDRYFVPITPPHPTDRIRIGEYSVIEVYDTDYRLVGRFSA